MSNRSGNMKLKQLWTAVPIPAQVKLFWERVSFSRITKFYFIFSVLHCLVQVIFQIQAFSINARAGNFLWHLVTQADAVDPGFAVFGDDELRFCDSVPDNLQTTTCQLIWAASGLKKNDTGSSEVPESSTLGTTTAALSSTTEGPATSTVQETSSFLVTETVVSVISSPALQSTPTPTSTSSPIIEGGEKEGQEEHGEDEEDDGEDEVGDDDDDDDGVKSVASVDSAVSGNNVGSDVDELEKRDHSGFQIAVVNFDGGAEVVINGFGFNDETLNLSKQCLYTLNWPVEKLDNTKREDITFIAFQFWVLGMSTVALLNESIPHIVASLLTHILATAWGGFQVQATKDFRENFIELTVNGACGVNLLRNYWGARVNAEIASLVLNAAALLLSAFLSWRLFKLFGWQTFKRVGASRTINRVYKLVLTLSIAIQLSLFFIVVSIALWLDSLYNGVVGRLSTNPGLFKAVVIVVIVLLIPWLTMGWIAVRRELRIPMFLFLVLSFGYLVGWGAMFVSPTFRWTFVLWRFFTLMTSASVFLTLVTLVIGILCRINFGKGLPRYLNAEEPLPDNFEPVAHRKVDCDDEEKVEFPSGRAALPTYSAAFAQNTPPSQMNFGTPRVGPRFTNPSIEPFESDRSSRVTDESSYQGTYSYHSNDSGYQTSYTRETYLRNTFSDGATLIDQRQHSRQVSIGSQRSYGSSQTSSSVGAHGSTSSRGSLATASAGRRKDAFSKRWMIE